MITVTKNKFYFAAIILVVLLASSVYLNKQKNRLLTDKINQTQELNQKHALELARLERKIDNNSITEAVGAEYASLLTVYTASNANGPLKLFRLGKNNDGGYVVPEIALAQSQALMGYGIGSDISFEEEFSNRYNREAYGFDCIIQNIEIKNKLTHFIPECLSTNTYVYDSTEIKQLASVSHTSTFPDELTKLNLQAKKIFIKMDIEGAEYEAIPSILTSSQNITGISLELHLGVYPDLSFNEQIEKAIKLLRLIEKDFLLVHLHANNCFPYGFTTKNSQGEIPKLIELSFINKNLVTSATVAKDQSHPSTIDEPNCPHLDAKKFSILTQ